MKRNTLIFVLIGIPAFLFGQTDSDGIRMAKGSFCGGVTYNYSSWDHYWEGTFRRDNENIGRVISSSIGVMGTWGVLDRLNIIFSVPFVMTRATRGTLKGQQGIQDLNIFLKLLAFSRDLTRSGLQVYTVLGGSTPLDNYPADFMPLSVGTGSTTVNARLIGDYQRNNFFLTASGSYVHRFNIKIGRDAYYTDKMVYSDKVLMPDAFTSKIGLGFRKGELIMEGILDMWNTLGGFDIRKNDMPFPSNKMRMTRTGVNLKIPVEKISGLSLVGNSFYAVQGRNSGQTLSGTIGLFYIFN